MRANVLKFFTNTINFFKVRYGPFREFVDISSQDSLDNVLNC